METVKSYDSKFKQDALKLLTKGGRSFSEASKESCRILIGGSCKLDCWIKLGQR